MAAQAALCWTSQALTDAGLGVKVWGQQGVQLPGDPEGWWAGRPGFSQLGQAGKRSGGSAESAGDVKEMAGAGGGAKQGLSLGNAADEDDIGDGDGRFGEVAAGQRGLVSGGEGEQAVKEGVHPG